MWVTLTDGAFMSPKYHSQSITMASPHIVVLANWLPDFTQLTADRWRLINVIALRDALAAGESPDGAISTVRDAAVPSSTFDDDHGTGFADIVDSMDLAATSTDLPAPATEPESLGDSAVIDLTSDDELLDIVVEDADDERGRCSWESCTFDDLPHKSCTRCHAPGVPVLSTTVATFRIAKLLPNKTLPMVAQQSVIATSVPQFLHNTASKYTSPSLQLPFLFASFTN